MNTIIINNKETGRMSIIQTASNIDTDFLDIMADGSVLTGTIEGIVEGKTCSQQYCVTYKNGERVRFRVGTFMKGRS